MSAAEPLETLSLHLVRTVSTHKIHILDPSKTDVVLCERKANYSGFPSMDALVRNIVGGYLVSTNSFLSAENIFCEKCLERVQYGSVEATIVGHMVQARKALSAGDLSAFGMELAQLEKFLNRVG